MEATGLNPKNAYHIRSNSLPSRPHPFVDQVDNHLCRLKASEASSSSSEICHKLGGLRDLHDSVDKLLLLPVLVHESDKKWFDELLEGSVRLLDLYGVAKDALLQTKECIYGLESVLRRRKGGEVFIANEVQKCLSYRKMIKKTICRALKEVERKRSEKTQVNPAIVSQLKEVEAVSYAVVESLLTFIAGSYKFPLMSRWSMVGKLLKPKRIACQVEEASTNEVAMVDAALYSMTSNKTDKSDFVVQVENLQNSLRKFGSTIQEVEDEVESLYRRIIKTRVSLLNILNH